MITKDKLSKEECEQRIKCLSDPDIARHLEIEKVYGDTRTNELYVYSMGIIKGNNKEIITMVAKCESGNGTWIYSGNNQPAIDQARRLLEDMVAKSMTGVR